MLLPETKQRKQIITHAAEKQNSLTEARQQETELTHAFPLVSRTD